jgi:uncharacterized lipoprotein YddW (UPF0748 family)
MDKRKFLKINGMIASGIALGASNLLFTQCDEKEKAYNWERNWMWLHANMERTDEEWNAILSKLKDAGISGILIGGDVPMYERIIPLADKFDIDVHAWMWTLNRNGDKEALKHPDWYTVSRKGDSCFDVRPYVDYYQWVCPSKDEVYEHIKSQVERLSSVEGIKGIHLDYVRYSDVILAKALQPQYGLVQDKEYPEFDFCYCETCRDKFLEQSGIDVYELEDPTASAEWRQYRYDSVTELVNRLVEVAHGKDKLITAAVFPYPELARTICRQSWDDWNLDAFFPMVYQNFYDEDIPWIKYATEQGVNDLNGKAPLITGLYLPEIADKDFSSAVKKSFEGGAKGVALFDWGGSKDIHYDVMRNFQIKK